MSGDQKVFDSKHAAVVLCTAASKTPPKRSAEYDQSSYTLQTKGDGNDTCGDAGMLAQHTSNR